MGAAEEVAAMALDVFEGEGSDYHERKDNLEIGINVWLPILACPRLHVYYIGKSPRTIQELDYNLECKTRLVLLSIYT